MSPQDILRRLLDAALRAAQPAACLEQAIPADFLPPPGGRLLILGAGKASAAMAQAVEKQLLERTDCIPEGLVVTRYGHAVPCRHIEIVEAAHPVPDAAGQAVAARMLALAEGLRAEDRVIFLVSGGGSALLVQPAEGITLADKQAVSRALLRSGASIGEMNCVRKHLSAIKGGRLAAAAWPAPVLTLAISDVPGDDPAVIASGPTVPDPGTCAEALAIVRRYGIELPAAAAAALAAGAWESPKPGVPWAAAGRWQLVASPRQMLEAAAAEARALGLTPLILGDALEGEAREVGRVMAGMALSSQRFGTPLARPGVLLSGGETTVTLRGAGRGGRNTEFLLALALALGGAPGIHALAADTDGIDGSEDNAGAFIGPETLSRAEKLGVSASERLAANDAWGFFSALDDLLLTGPTLTNVNDFRAILLV